MAILILKKKTDCWPERIQVGSMREGQTDIGLHDEEEIHKELCMDQMRCLPLGMELLK